MIDNSNGRRWARFTLALALVLSVAGNVVHTVLADSTIHLALRIPPAVAWPVLTFLGIEVLVRIVWDRSFTHRLARNLVLIPAVPAAIVSYEHLYSLLLLMGERWQIALIGPAAIDGAMIGMTMVLLFTRPGMAAAPAAPTEPTEIDVDAILERHGITAEELPIPISPAPAAAPAIERAPRAARTAYDVRRVAELAVDGTRAGQIHELTGASKATAYRFTKVAALLRANPRAEIDSTTEKVHPEHVSIMRELVTK